MFQNDNMNISGAYSYYFLNNNKIIKSLYENLFIYGCEYTSMVFNVFK